MRASVVVLLCALALAACGGGSDTMSDPQTIRVSPGDGAIQEAVDGASAGDIVLLAPGVYHEDVRVATEGITIRGEDRNAVILDGEDRLQNGFWVTADDVAIENLTVRHFTNNGILFTRIGEDVLEQVESEDGGDNATRSTIDPAADLLSGYRASYVTAYSNGLYGLYAFASTNGVFEHTYASGHPDSGYYVGQCKPCNAVLRDVTAERNAIGYEGTNASGGVYIVESLFTRNRLGITPNSQDAERLAPQGETVVAGNRVIDNADPQTPAIDNGYFGGGILIGGGERNTVVRNLVTGNPDTGIGIFTLGRYQPNGNRVEGNMSRGNGVDLVYAPTGLPDAAGNCFAGNTFATSLPRRIERALPCDGPSALRRIPLPPRTPVPPGIDYLDVPAPPDQPQMPAAAMSATGGAGKVPPAVDLEAIEVPAP